MLVVGTIIGAGFASGREIVTFFGEYLVSGAGLGYLIIYGGQVFKIDLVMTATVILCVLAAGMYGVVALLGKLFARYEKQ